MTNWYHIRKYLAHRRKAKQLHGVHSPFVYSFVENIIKEKAPAGNLMLVTSKHKKLINRLIQHFGCRHILWLTNRHGDQETFISMTRDDNGTPTGLKSESFEETQMQQYPPPDLLLINLKDPGDWSPAFQKYYPLLTERSIVIVLSPHHTPQHATAWAALHGREEVRLSMDLYRVGILLFRKEFKDKQHFLLKLK